MKVAVLLGDARLDTLRRARVLAEAVLAARPASDVCIGLPVGDEVLWKRNAEWVSGGMEAVTVRRLSWERVLADNAKRMFMSNRLPVALQGIDRVTLPRDWGSNFLDCDIWMIVAGAEIGGVYPVRPTAIYCSDLSARRVPAAYAPTIHAPYWQDQTTAFRLWRQSAVVVASDPITAADLLYYAGVSPDRIVQLSQPLDLVSEPRLKPAQSNALQLVVRIEPDALHAVDLAILAIRRYLGEGGKLKPVIATEAPTDAFGAGSNIPQIALLSSHARDMLIDLRVERIVSHERWEMLMSSASAIWMAAEAGCDGANLRRALRTGKPILAPKNPQSGRALEQAGGILIEYGTATSDDRVEALHRLEEAMSKVRSPAAIIKPDRSVLSREVSFLIDRLMGSCHG